MTPDRNKRRRERYAEQTGKADRDQARQARDFGIVGDREIRGLSLRQIAKKRGLSLGAIQSVLKNQLKADRMTKASVTTSPHAEPEATDRPFQRQLILTNESEKPSRNPEIEGGKALERRS